MPKPKKPVKQRVEEKKFNFRVIEELAGLGCTDEQIANILDVDKRTITRWKEDPQFKEALIRGKDKADNEVVKCLYKRATGYNAPDIYITHHQGKIISKKITKHYPPDVVAQIFWLKNRQPDKWIEKQQIEHKEALTVEIYLPEKKPVETDTEKNTPA